MVHKLAYTIGVLATIVIVGWVLTVYTQIAVASAPSGLAATMSTSSQSTVGTTAIVLFATSTNCATRVISTKAASGMMLTFTDKKGTAPSATKGFWHAPSTTIAYDAGLYGCGLVRGYSYASQLVDLAETF